MAVIESEIYFRFRFWWWYSFGKMEVYWHTKFRWVISIHSWDKTTSGFEKQMAAILNFYFGLLFLPNFRHRRVILHWPTTFRQNWTTVGGVMTSYRFFSRWRPAAIMDLIWITLDHPRSAIVGLRLVLKFGFDRIHSFKDIVIFIFCRFGLKLPIHAHFLGVVGAYFPQMTSPIILTPKRHFLRRKHVVWVIKRENWFSGSTWARSREKKDRTGQDRTVKRKSHKVVIFCLYGEKPLVYRLDPKFAWWIASPT